MLKTAICNLFGIQYPIIQGGMAHLATAELASAVSNAGGLGIIAAANYDAGWLREQVRTTRKLTSKPFGVNLFLPSPFIEEQINVILTEKVPLVITGAGNPEAFLSRFKKSGVKMVPVISSVRLAKRMQQSGADAVIAEGMEAGGHIGEITTMALVPQVVDAVSIPVIAAGGIADGRGMVAALALGAQGIQMGTRFICSEECVGHSAFKAKILEAGDEDTVVTGKGVQHSVRCLVNSYTDDYTMLEKSGATHEELDMFGNGRLHLGVIEGHIDEGSLMAGQIAGLIKDIKPVKAIIEDMIAQAEEIIANLFS